MGSLVEAITELVIKELAKVRTGGDAPSSQPPPAPRGARLLVVPGPEPVAEEVWNALASVPSRSSALVWNGFRQDQLPASAARWPLEARGTGWSKVVGDYQAVCLLGSDLPILGSIAHLGAGGQPPAAVAVAGVASGLPVFCETGLFERVRRHSARLAPGFVRAFEEAWRGAASFGIELGGPAELGAFLSRLTGKGAASAPAAKNGGRDVVTGEDVEAARRAGLKQLLVGMGAIVTPLARQQAAEWGIEVKFQ
jgi:hypothetical protein